MKYDIFKGLLIGGIVVALAGCDENSWNDEHLDGFQTPTLTNKTVIEYTLTSKDYSNIATKVGANIQMAAEAGMTAQLQAVGKLGYFTEDITARQYVPAFLDSVSKLTTYPFYALDDRSTVKVSYKVAENQPAEVLEIENAPKYEVSEADYQAVYGSDEKYANSFSPSNQPGKFIPGFLKEAYPNAADGDFVYVTYNMSSQDPVFGGGDAPAPDVFEMSDVLGSVEPNVDITVNGIVTAICTDGMILTDKGGSIFLYGKNPGNNYAVGDLITMIGAPSLQSKNNYYSVTMSKSEIEKKGTQTYTYPAPAVLDGPAVLARLKEMVDDGKNILPSYVEVTGTVATSESGGYVNYNVLLDGVESSACQISIYRPMPDMVPLIVNGTKVKITGYLISRSSSRYVNVVPVAITPANAPLNAAAPASRAATPLASEKVNAVYKFNGSKWTQPDNIVVLTDADYASMGVDDLNASAAAEKLPIFLKAKFPYAAIGDVKFVVYNYYDASNKTNIPQHCDRCIYDGSTWAINTVEEKVAQFVRKDAKWVYDPSIYITIPADYKDEAAVAFWQGCVNWVWENVDVKELGLSEDQRGQGYVDSRNNQEYYAGASSYYCNYDNRLSTFKSRLGANFATFYGDVDEKEFNAMTRDRLTKEVLVGVLPTLYPDAKPGDGVDLYYIITFTDYTTSSTATVRYLVTAPATFEFADAEWTVFE